MSRTIDKLVHMANQIATAFAHQEPDKAVAATYDHIWHFWDPRMRRLILEHLGAGGVGLGPIARGAIERLAIGRVPVPVTRATEFAPAAGGAAPSDAG